MLIASYNPGYQRNLRELKPSTRQRFVALSFGYPNEDTETRILIGETGIDEKTARRLVRIAHKIRQLTELSLLESVSTRLLVDTAQADCARTPSTLCGSSCNRRAIER